MTGIATPSKAVNVTAGGVASQSGPEDYRIRILSDMIDQSYLEEEDVDLTMLVNTMANAGVVVGNFDNDGPVLQRYAFDVRLIFRSETRLFPRSSNANSSPISHPPYPLSFHHFTTAVHWMCWSREN